MLSEEPSQPACYLIRAMVTAVSFPEIKKDPFGDGLINTFFLAKKNKLEVDVVFTCNLKFIFLSFIISLSIMRNNVTR